MSPIYSINNMISSYHLPGTVLGTNGCKCKENRQGIYNLHTHANRELKSMVNTIVLWEHIRGLPNSSLKTIKGFPQNEISKLGPEGKVGLG